MKRKVVLDPNTKLKPMSPHHKDLVFLFNLSLCIYMFASLLFGKFSQSGILLLYIPLPNPTHKSLTHPYSLCFNLRAQLAELKSNPSKRKNKVTILKKKFAHDYMRFSWKSPHHWASCFEISHLKQQDPQFR